jgi:L-2-hydroxyglutarate oxidase
LEDSCDIAIIGGGILGASLAYFLSQVSDSKVTLVEQENSMGVHTSSRNTGKVHAPFLYDPATKGLFAKAAFLGYNMWKEYCGLRSLPFKPDGVLEVATYEGGVNTLQKYLDWGYSNGLDHHELKILDRKEVARLEPNVRCIAAIYCSRDASVDYGAITSRLAEDAKQSGSTIKAGEKVEKIACENSKVVIHTSTSKIFADFVINAAGGSAVDIAHDMEVAEEYVDLHFRGEYWRAPEEYHNLTKMIVYSVPKYPEYPFLDPHWVIRVDGRREVGPNAVPVFGPYAYNWRTNLSNLFPKLFELLLSGARKIIFDRQFLFLAKDEFKSSLSKTAMINRVREFLPQLNPSAFRERGTAGIRSSLVDKAGNFVPDTLIVRNDRSLHLLNYNSPGATGALPIASMIVNQLIENEIASRKSRRADKLTWDITMIADEMRA